MAGDVQVETLVHLFTFVLQDSGSPTLVLLKDRFLQATVLGWVASFIIILYRK